MGQSPSACKKKSKYSDPGLPVEGQRLVFLEPSNRSSWGSTDLVPCTDTILSAASFDIEGSAAEGGLGIDRPRSLEAAPRYPVAE